MKRDLVLFWNQKMVELLNYHINPGSDARRMAIFQIGIHDALNSVKSKYDHYAFSQPQSPQASAEAAVNAAAKKLLDWAIKDIADYRDKMTSIGATFPFPDFNESILWGMVDVAFSSQMNNIPDNQRKTLGRNIGESAADDIISNRENDGHKDIKIASPTPPDGTLPGQYKSNYTAPIKLMTDFGTVVRLFVLTLPDQFTKPIDALDINNTELGEVELKGTEANYTNNLSPSEKQITDMWNDTKQHIVWNNFAVEIIKEQNPSFDAWDTARLLALIHTAMADGTICMFRDLYTYYRWRPITALNPTPKSGTGWQPYSPTPRVPEYPSTFGILGGATGEILTKIFSDTINITFNSIPYTSIAQAVKDNTETKLYLGWNFRSTFQPSITMGKEIGDYVFRTKFN